MFTIRKIVAYEFMFLPTLIVYILKQVCITHIGGS